LARRLEGTRRTANAIHPGVIFTNLSRHMHPVARLAFQAAGSLFMKNVAEGAATQCYVATHPAAATISGKYWVDSNVAEPRADGTDPATAVRLWTVTEELVSKI